MIGGRRLCSRPSKRMRSLKILIMIRMQLKFGTVNQIISWQDDLNEKETKPRDSLCRPSKVPGEGKSEESP